MVNSDFGRLVLEFKTENFHQIRDRNFARKKFRVRDSIIVETLKFIVNIK